MKSIWRINVQWRRATGAASARQQGCQFLLCCRYITFWSFYCSRVVTLGYFWGSSKMFICISVKLAPCPTIFHLFWVVKWGQMIGIQVLLRSKEMSCEHAWLATIWWRSCFRSWPNPLLLQFYIARRVEPQDIITVKDTRDVRHSLASHQYLVIQMDLKTALYSKTC